MAISLSSSQEKKESINFTTNVFWNLLGMLFFLVLVFGILKLYDASLKSGISSTKLAIQEIEKQRDLDVEKQMKNTLDIYEKTSSALSSHTKTSKILDFIQKNTYEGVSFSDFNYNRKENSVSLNATSKIAGNLSMQLAVFRNAKGVQSIEVGGFSINEKVISLQIKIIIDPLIVKFSK